MMKVRGCVIKILLIFYIICKIQGGPVQERIDLIVERSRKKALTEALDAEFDIADRDGDGVVSKEEFIDYVMKENGFGKVPKQEIEGKAVWLGKKTSNEENKIPVANKTPAPAANMPPPNLRHQDQENTGDIDFSTTNPSIKEEANGFWAAFFNAVAMIVVTELGDKTFFIAALMAMKYSRVAVYGGAIGALALMTILSALIGFALPNILPRIYTHYGAVLLFLVFGIKMLREAYELYQSKETKNEELEETEMELNDLSSKSGDVRGRKQLLVIVSQSFTLTFLAEWGDRSQIATIALASSKNPYGVTTGGILGHAACTGLAVLGGRLLASRISEKQVTLCGGVLFCVFALHALLVGPDS